MIIKQSILLLLLFTLVSCNEVPGVLSVFSTFHLIDRSGDAILLNNGQHRAELKFKSKKRLKLKITDNQNESIKFIFNIPKHADIPKHNGEFFLSAEDVEQPYNLYGTISTVNIDSEPIWAVETCTYQKAFTICYPRHPGGGGNICHIEYRTMIGRRNVNFFTREQNISLQIDFLEGDEGERADKLAQFLGADIIRYNVYLYEGVCE